MDQYFLLYYFHLHDLGLYVQDSQRSLQQNKQQTTNKIVFTMCHEKRKEKKQQSIRELTLYVNLEINKRLLAIEISETNRGEETRNN